MEKTVILVVDRDDDFGVKGGVTTPAIGIDSCLAAATALAVADPEDSDSNALFAAIKIYREMETTRDPGTFEIALICGDHKVGIKSDEKIIQEFNQVVDVVHPDGAVLVGDGAEDEYIYPIISSRLHIDSVRNVYVKQDPGVEGTMYIIGKYLKDPDKKRRFIAPFAFILIAIGVIYLISNAMVYKTLESFFQNSTTVLIFIVIGLGVLWYCYDISDWLECKFSRLKAGMKYGTTILTVTLSVLFVVLGIVLGLYSLDNTYTYRDTQRIILFVANALWPFIFAVMFLHLGGILSDYVSTHVIRYSSIFVCTSLIGTGLVTSGFLDFLLEYVSVYSAGSSMYVLEVISGFLILLVCATVIIHIRRKNASERE